MATAEPDIEPKRQELMTAMLAGPPGAVPVNAWANDMKYGPVPHFSRNPPKIRKAATSVAETPNGMENMPSSVRYISSTTSRSGKAIPSIAPGSLSPRNIYAAKRKAMIVSGRPTTRRVPSSSRTKSSMPK